MDGDPDFPSLMDEKTRKIVEDHVLYIPRPDQGWKSCPELPTSEELLMRQEEAEGLPANPVDRPWASKEEYLAAQYKILRREGIEGLRFSVRAYMDACANRQEKTDDDHTCVYTSVHVRSYLLSALGPIARIEFSTARSPFQIKWRQSKRLTPGTIVALTTKADSFNSCCKIATIAQRPYIGGLDQDPPVVDLVWADQSDAVFDPDLELVMIESRDGYYEATRHALVGLQHALGTTSTLDKYLTGEHVEDVAPEFVQRSPLMNLSSLAHKFPSGKAKKRLEFLEEYDVLTGVPDVEDITTLDDSQLRALHRIISKELAIIQGPPGTGKTFTSVEALKVMVATRQKCGGQAIVVAAQTNHALDQLLNHCLDFGASICRVGGRTESDRIGEHTVYNIRQRTKFRADPKFRTLDHSRRNVINQIRNLVADIFGDKLLSPSALLQTGIISQAQHDSLYDDTMATDERTTNLGPFSLWLGEDLVPATIVRDKHPTQAQVDEVAEKMLADWEIDGDVDNIADDEEDLDRIHGSVVELRHVWSGKEPGHLKTWDRLVRKELSRCQDLFAIPAEIRGAVYQHFQARLLESLTPKFTGLLHRHQSLCKHVKANKWFKDIQMINKEAIDIVGCTTTGLTKYRGFLSGLQPSSLLIEEAAESREANITSAIYPSLQQLILVGDHQQLAPQCDIRWLGEEPYNLNVSLFQRMVNLQMPFVMLNQQRRMRPELRFILSPFYPDLKDHPDIRNETGSRPDVPGMGERNCWLFCHTWPEGTNSEQSRYNEQEALMIIKFYAYLVANGTPADKITVLTFYNGQRKFLVNRLKKEGALIGTTFRVHTVDSYQGEENDVVLLSLVRSPVHSPAVGFLDDQRRAVVAISRARRGFYIFGNIDNLLNAHVHSLQLWGKVWNGFAKQQRVKRLEGLPLICQQHGNETWVKELDDWGDNAGGCDLQCEAVRPCGHKCTLKCHFVPHERLPCSQPCRKSLECGHGCEKYCSQVCHCSCTAFRDSKIRKEAAAAQHAMGDEDEMGLEERMLGQLRNPPEFLKAAANRNQLPSSRTTGSTAQTPKAVRPGQHRGHQGGSTSNVWNEYTTQVAQDDEKIRQESRKVRAGGPSGGPSPLKIADTYKSTAVVDGRRTGGASKSTREIQVQASTRENKAQTTGKRAEASAARKSRRGIPLNQGRAGSLLGVVTAPVSTFNELTLVDSDVVDPFDVDLLTGAEVCDDIQMAPMKPARVENCLLGFDDGSM